MKEAPTFVDNIKKADDELPEGVSPIGGGGADSIFLLVGGLAALGGMVGPVRGGLVDSESLLPPTNPEVDDSNSSTDFPEETK